VTASTPSRGAPGRPSPWCSTCAREPHAGTSIRSKAIIWPHRPLWTSGFVISAPIPWRRDCVCAHSSLHWLRRRRRRQRRAQAPPSVCKPRARLAGRRRWSDRHCIPEARDVAQSWIGSGTVRPRHRGPAALHLRRVGFISDEYGFDASGAECRDRGVGSDRSRRARDRGRARVANGRDRDE
jgi:hypothetical protein